MAEEDTPKIHIDSDWKAEAQAKKERLQLLSPARGGAGDRGGPERSAGFMIRTLVCACVLATASGLPCSGARSPVNAVAIKLVGNEPGWSHVGDSNWRVDEQGWIFPPAWPETRITFVGSYSYDLARTDYAFFTGAALADVELSVDFKIYYSTAPYAGVAFRAQDSARCYLVEVRAVARDWQVYRVILWRQDEAGIWHELAAAEHPLPEIDHPFPENKEQWVKSSPDWATLGVKATGSRMEVVLNGKTLLAVEDDAYPAGYVGLFAHGPALFRNLHVRGTEGAAPRPWTKHEGALPRYFYPGKDGKQPQGFNAFPAVAVRGETVYVAWAHGRASLFPTTALLTRSDDGGRTWTVPRRIERPELMGTGKNTDGLPSFVYSLFVHEDGRLSAGYGVGGYRRPREVEAGFFYSDDRGDTWSEPVDFRPEGKDIHHWGGWALQPYGPITRLSDGTLVMTWWQRTATADDPHRCRSILFRSTDDGRTWSAPIYFDEENYDTNEAMVAEAAPGKLIVFTRPSGSRTMWTGTSDDNGLTWTKLAPSGLIGYSPILLAHGSGAIVMATRDGGRDSINLSFDRGRSWSRRYRMSPAGGMLNMVELSDGTVLIVMAEGYRAGQSVRAQRFRVTEAGPVPVP